MDDRDDELALMPLATGCISGGDAGRSGGGRVGSGLTACIVDGTIGDGGCSPTNHMMRTPITAPPANEMSVVLVASRHRSRTWPIQSGTVMASVERA